MFGADSGLNWFLTQPIWPVILVGVAIVVIYGQLQKREERVRGDE